MTHWATQYVGREWRRDYDCWAFFREVQATHFNRDVPIIDIDSTDQRQVLRTLVHHPERKRWRETVLPREGDAVLLSRTNHPAHVGVWVDVGTGRVLHNDQRSGVCCQSLSSLELAGWSNITWWTPCF